MSREILLLAICKISERIDEAFVHKSNLFIISEQIELMNDQDDRSVDSSERRERARGL
ncbi:MAG: hypothetical protein V3W17_06795 [Desulfobacteria bacterium]